jgi:hypothetical protein
MTGWDEAVSVFRASRDECLDGQPESTQSDSRPAPNSCTEVSQILELRAGL